MRVLAAFSRFMKIGVQAHALRPYPDAMPYLFLAIAVAAEVTATSFLKLSEGFTKLVPSIVTVIGYAVAFYGLSIALKSIPTGIAYAIWAGIGIVLIAAIAWIFQGQKLDTAAVIGMGLIIAGVVVLNVFSNAGAH
jgi:small multidrug resistance pump